MYINLLWAVGRVFHDNNFFLFSFAIAGLPGVLGRTCTTEPGNPGKEKETMQKCARLCEECGLKPKRRVMDVATSCNCR